MDFGMTACLIFALVIVVRLDGATAQFYHYQEKNDQLAQEAKNRAVTIIDGPKYVAPPPSNVTTAPPPAPPSNETSDPRPPSKPPHPPSPDKQGKHKYVELPRIYIGQLQNLPIRNTYPKQVKIHSPSSVYKIHKVIPIQGHRNNVYPKQQLVFAASTSKPSVAAKTPKFSLPVETINGIRADFVRPPHFINNTSTTTTTSTSTTTTATTTKKYLRTKRIWPKRVLDKLNPSNTTSTTPTNNTNSDGDLSSSGSHHRIIIIDDSKPAASVSSTRPPYRRVTRGPSKRKPSTTPETVITHVEPNDWVPIVPSHYSIKKVRNSKQTHTRSRRSDRSNVYLYDPHETPNENKRTIYLQSFGLLPVASSASPDEAATATRKNLIIIGKTNKLKPHVYSGYRGKPVVHTTHINGDYQTDESVSPNFITKIKHHHHHHHHRYVKTVEKQVKVEVPKPVPVPVPMPVPVQVEKKVPYPVQVKVPHPVPVKVIQKEYVPKPYPVMQQVPMIKHVEVKVPQPVPVEVEKRVPYPVEVPKPYPVPVPVEKRVPYPVPVRVLVPQPYPVETKVPVPVKEPVEVIKHVHIKVPVPQPYPVRIPVQVPVEKRVPYPVEVEKRVPVPYRVVVPEKVEVEKRVPVYIPRPYPVEKRIHVPVKIPYPVRVPIRVPVGIPIIMHPSPNNDNNEQYSGNGITDDGSNGLQQSPYSFSVQEDSSVSPNGNYVTEFPHQTVSYHGNTVTSTPHRSVTLHGKGFNGFQSRSDVVDETTTPFYDNDTSLTPTSTEFRLIVPDFTTQPTAITTITSESTTTPNPR